ncbi:hypothetical protein IKG38_03560 [Candidatus Saccharibacteria bacterium]|jgi:hypothetical protein|nr:hypothetical protein [Candidatus Saccharibacteria bacterium]
MDSYFDSEIKRVEQELLTIKTSAQKSASMIQTVTKTIPITVTLSDDGSASYPTARAAIHYQINTDEYAITIPTLDWYFQDITKASTAFYTTRQIQLFHVMLPNGKDGLRIYVFGTENSPGSDGERVGQGETVKISFNLTIRSTVDFTVEEYHD